MKNVFPQYLHTAGNSAEVSFSTINSTGCPSAGSAPAAKRQSEACRSKVGALGAALPKQRATLPDLTS